MLKAKLKTEEVRKFLLRENISQSEFAARTGISFQYISFLLKGQYYPGPRIRSALMREIGTDFDALFEIVETDVPSKNGSH